MADAEAAVEAGADLLGLNFYAGNKRRIDLATARAIAAAVAGRSLIVGVFVNHSAAEIHAIAQSVPLDVVQLHGDEPPLTTRPSMVERGGGPTYRFSPLFGNAFRTYRCGSPAV
jgi:phosphoribosylanthranilate isomerase